MAAIAIFGALVAGRVAARLHRRLESSREAEQSRRARVVWETLAAAADGVD